MKMPVVVAILALALSVAPAWAQQSGAIVGQVRDTTGAVLPGVTVEVSSPTLIEKVRSSVSDGGGLYRIIDLPAGTYRVTFGLAGFSTVRREGITLTVNFTATVNADLAVGSVEETVTVTGASPIVDVRNAVQQTVLSREVLDVIPIGKQYTSAGSLIPGMLVRASTPRAQFDVGGGAGWDGQYLMIHGSRQIDQVLLLDGLPSQHFDGAAIAIAPSDGSVQEQAIEAGAHMAEAETGGVYINVFHKSGGNTFHGAVPFSFTNDKLQSKNVTAEQIAIGVPPTNGNNYLMDLNPSFGGPIRRDRLWFNASVRTSRVSRQSGTYYDTDSTDWAYIPDRSRGSVPDVRPQDDMTVRLTWQATARHQISVNTQYGQAVRCCQFMAGNRTFDASTKTTNVGKPMLHGTWTFPVTDHVLMEAGAEAFFMQLNPAPTGNAIFPAALEQNGGWEFRSTFARGNQVYNSTKYYSFFSRFALKYVTGSHAFKVGGSLWPQREHLTYYGNGYYSVTLLNTVPTFVTYLPEPREQREQAIKGALFVQDQWTVKRLTLTGGLRLDTMDAGYPDTHLQATAILPARDFPAADVTQWRDLSPRFGIAYDVFGNGRTAIKGSVNRYVLGQSVGATARTANPASAAGDVNQRIWHDDNRDYIPQGDPLNPAANGEIGPSTNLNFGLPKFSSRFDPAYMHGDWGVRGYNWEMTSSIQQELASGVSATAAYFRRIYGNATVTDNLLLGPGDYDSFCITAPNDPRLPGNGGYPLCGLSNIKPASLAKGTDNFITLAKNYGDLIEHYDGVDLTVSARMRGGLLMAGGLNLGRTFTDNCSLIDKLPETVVSTPSSYCHASTPWQQQVKFYASYGLPWAMQLSGTFQDAFVFGGIVSSVNLGVQANYVATNAVVQPSLGRPLAGASNVTVNLITPGSDYQNRVRQLDLRVSRLFTAGGAKLRTMVDLYNVFNTNPMVEWNNSYGTNGATWLTPLTILSPRLIKFGVQLDF